MTSNQKTLEVNYWHIVIIIATVLIVGGGVGAIFLNNKLQTERQVKIQNEQRQREESARKAEQDKSWGESAAKSLRQQQLNSCLDNVNSWYNENSKGPHYQEYWDALLASKNQQINECQIRYQ